LIAVDTNLLIYAHRASMPEHRAARRSLERAARSEKGWGVTQASLGEFWAVVTHPASSGRPSTGAEAAGFLFALLRDGGAQLWGPGPGFGERLLRLAAEVDVRGVRVFDLQIALTAFENGADEIWTHDRGFVSLPGLRVRDPLEGRP
jgi:hypothetical protein